MIYKHKQSISFRYLAVAKYWSMYSGFSHYLSTDSPSEQPETLTKWFSRQSIRMVQRQGNGSRILTISVLLYANTSPCSLITEFLDFLSFRSR